MSPGRAKDPLRTTHGFIGFTRADGRRLVAEKISTIETGEVIEPELLDELAQALKVPAEAIRNVDEQKAMYNIQNNYEGSNNHGSNGTYTFNPIDEIKRLNDKNEKLYEVLLK